MVAGPQVHRGMLWAMRFNLFTAPLDLFCAFPRRVLTILVCGKFYRVFLPICQQFEQNLHPSRRYCIEIDSKRIEKSGMLAGEYLPFSLQDRDGVLSGFCAHLVNGGETPMSEPQGEVRSVQRRS